MSRMIRFVVLFALGMVVAAPVFAEDKAATAPAAPAAPAATAPSDQSSAPAAPEPASPLGDEAAPAAPAPVAPPALKPIQITFSGEVASVSAAENPPKITIQDRYSTKKEIGVPPDAKITAGTASKSLSDLKAGDKVTVVYTYDVATGDRTALTITVGEATPEGS